MPRHQFRPGISDQIAPETTGTATSGPYDLADVTSLSYDIELSFLPISRARPAPSATQLSSARGRRPARRHVHAAWESAEVVTQAPWQANFAVTSDRSEASETGKPDSLSGEG